MGENNGAYLHRFLGGEKHQGTDPAFQDQLGKDLEPRTCGEEENASLGIPTPYAPEKQGRSFLNGTNSILGAGVQIPLPFLRWSDGVLEERGEHRTEGGHTALVSPFTSVGRTHKTP